MASSKSKNNKKAVVDYTKREKKTKETLLLEASVHPILDNELVDGEFELLGEIKRYGKLYYQVKNNVIQSL